MTIRRILETDGVPAPLDADACPHYEEWSDEWQGQGAMGALIPGGSGCHLSSDDRPSCQGDVAKCPLPQRWKETQ